MQMETEQLLGTLQVLTEPDIQFRFQSNERSSFVPFVWDSHEKGELNIWSLSYAEGWIQLTDIDVALSSWQAVENRGSLDPDFDPEFLEDDDTNHAVDEVTQVTRAKKYLALSQLLQSELQELEIFKLSSRPIYSFCVVIGRTKNNDWICISPTVAQETKIGEELSRSPLPETNVTRQLGEDSLILQSKIEEIIAELEPIVIYGFYGGGYDYRFDYRLVSAVANTKFQALEEALRKAGMLEVYQFHEFRQDELAWTFEKDEIKELDLKYKQLNRFLRQKFPEMRMLRCSFWNWEHIYIIGQIQGGDWVGLYLESEFDFNP